MNYLQLHFRDDLVFEVIEDDTVVKNTFIFLMYPSWSLGSLFLEAVVVGVAVIRSSPRVSTGEYLELGASIGMLEVF